MIIDPELRWDHQDLEQVAAARDESKSSVLVLGTGSENLFCQQLNTTLQNLILPYHVPEQELFNSLEQYLVQDTNLINIPSDTAIIIINFSTFSLDYIVANSLINNFISFLKTIISKNVEHILFLSQPKNRKNNLIAQTDNNNEIELYSQLQILNDTNNNFSIVNLSQLLELNGSANYFDERLYFGFGFERSNIIDFQLSILIGSILDKIQFGGRKLVVVDLDNTFWPGVIGDDGPDAVAPNYSTAEGRAAAFFQHRLKTLKDNGFILAIVSKNNFGLVQEAFKNNNYCVELADFVSVKCNWDRKSENLRQILSDLGLSSRSVIFIDDNPAERADIHGSFPDVICLSGFEEIVGLCRKIKFLPSFFMDDVLGTNNRLTEEDRERNELYRRRSQAQKLKAETVTFSEYIKNLNQKVLAEPVNLNNEDRCFSLINKTNQFNLNGKRYSNIQQLHQFDSSWAFHLNDRFGKHGIISVLLGCRHQQVLKVQTWVLSCRAFSRNIEIEIIDIIFKSDKDLMEIKFHGTDTSRNHKVVEFFQQFDSFNIKRDRWANYMEEK